MATGTLGRAAAADGWFSCAPEEVAARLQVDPAVGLTSERGAALPLTAPQFGLAVGAAVLLLVLCELGKLVARRA